MAGVKSEEISSDFQVKRRVFPFQNMGHLMRQCMKHVFWGIAKRYLYDHSLAVYDDFPALLDRTSGSTDLLDVTDVKNVSRQFHVWE